MARVSKNKSRNPYIVVFWEGESEEQYLKFLKDRFHERANLKIHNKKGVFETAKKSFSKKGIYSDDLTDVDEIWLVFDTEPDLRVKWNEYWGIVELLRKMCKNATVRLYMTKGCIEYFFLLHYEKTAPLIAIPSDKEQIQKRLSDEKYCHGYKKGDKEAIWKIAERYEVGIENAEWSLKRIEDEWKAASNEDERTKILYFTDSTFTNAHEAVQHLIGIGKK